MPDTGIGFFPDIGATYVLPRLPGPARDLSGADRRAPFRAPMPFMRGWPLSSRLANCCRRWRATWRRTGRRRWPGTSHRCRRFPWHRTVRRSTAVSAPTAWLEVMRRLERDGSDSSPEDAGNIAEHVAVFADVVAETAAPGRGSDIAASAWMPSCVPTRTITPYREFIEGVRAMLVDKDREPRREPSRIEDVDPAEIDALLR